MKGIKINVFLIYTKILQRNSETPHSLLLIILIFLVEKGPSNKLQIIDYAEGTYKFLPCILYLSIKDVCMIILN